MKKCTYEICFNLLLYATIFCIVRWSHLEEEAQVDYGLAGAGKIWMGKDYVNFIFKDFTDLEMPYHGNI